jgi:phosphoglycolate phosphatase
LKLVIFDCDGTLVDSQHMILTAMGQAFGAHGIALPEREVLLSVIGLSLVEAFTKLGEGLEGFPAESLANHYRDAFHAMRAPGSPVEPLYPGAAEAIAALAQRGDVALGIATGKSQRGARLVLGHHGLLEHFITIKTADDAPSKPHPEMVRAAMQDAGAEPENTIVVGDTVYDIEMARAAGASGIGVTWGYHPRAALEGVGAVAVIDRFAHLVPALERIWAT